jgi:glucokinase
MVALDPAALAQDRRIVLTLDAGGTSFRFNAIQGGRLLLEPLRVATAAADLSACLEQLAAGFAAVQRAVGGEAVAISFAFPGPADYAAGIIGDLPNLTGFRGGVPLGPMLEARFGLPVFVNNDGALFTYGEALGGLLPWVNGALAAAGSARRHRNLAGFTLGTGFGGGLVIDGRLVRGDTSTAAQVWKLRHRDERRCFVEEGVSIRAVRRAYAEGAGIAVEDAPAPKEIGAIAEGRAPGDAAAARAAFEALGRVAGDAIAQVLTVIDGLAVIGGGLSAAAPLFLPALLAEVNGTLEWYDGRPTPRLLMYACDLSGAEGAAALFGDGPVALPVVGARREVAYEAEKRTGIGLTRLGTTEATALGAYAFALERLPCPGAA